MQPHVKAAVWWEYIKKKICQITLGRDFICSPAHVAATKGGLAVHKTSQAMRSFISVKLLDAVDFADFHE